jgi:class 3 adenylate cyclase
MSARLSAHDLIELLSHLFSAFDDLVAEAGLEKIKTIGDNYMAVGGLFGDDDHASRVVKLGLAMLEEARHHQAHDKPLELRVGVHTGPVSGGVIGTRKLAFDLWGDTVNVASRLQEVGPPGQLHISEQTRLLVGDLFECEPLGESQLRGHAGMPTYRVIAPANLPPQPPPTEAIATD